MNIYDMADTWNNASTTFNAIKMDAADDASAADSNLLWLGIDGNSLIRATKDGALFFDNGLNETATKTLLHADPLVPFVGAMVAEIGIGSFDNSGDSTKNPTLTWGFHSEADSDIFLNWVLESNFVPNPGQVKREGYLQTGLANGDAVRLWGFAFEVGATMALSTSQMDFKSNTFTFTDLVDNSILSITQSQVTSPYWRFAYSSGDHSVALEPQGDVSSNSGPLHLFTWHQINLPSLLKMPDAGVIFGPTNNAGSWSISGGGSNAGAVTVYGDSAGGGLAGVTKITGSGVLWYGTHSAIGAETLTGYITIKDAGGTVRKLAVVS